MLVHTGGLGVWRRRSRGERKGVREVQLWVQLVGCGSAPESLEAFLGASSWPARLAWPQLVADGCSVGVSAR